MFHLLFSCNPVYCFYKVFLWFIGSWTSLACSDWLFASTLSFSVSSPRFQSFIIFFSFLPCLVTLINFWSWKLGVINLVQAFRKSPSPIFSSFSFNLLKHQISKITPLSSIPIKNNGVGYNICHYHPVHYVYYGFYYTPSPNLYQWCLFRLQTLLHNSTCTMASSSVLP